MKRVFSVLLLVALCGAFAVPALAQATLTPVKAYHHRNRHRPHKAGKHARPHRHRRTV